MMEPPTALVEEEEAAPGEDHEGSWLVSALREQAEPAGEPPKSYWDAYLGQSSSSDTLDEGAPTEKTPTPEAQSSPPQKSSSI